VALEALDRFRMGKDGGLMKLWLVLVGSVVALTSVMVLFGVVPDCGQPTGLHWVFHQPNLCRTGFYPATPIEPSVIFAMTLALVLAVRLTQKFIRTKVAA
jgi:hypothetical protein